MAEVAADVKLEESSAAAVETPEAVLNASLFAANHSQITDQAHVKTPSAVLRALTTGCTDPIMAKLEKLQNKPTRKGDSKIDVDAAKRAVCTALAGIEAAVKPETSSNASTPTCSSKQNSTAFNQTSASTTGQAAPKAARSARPPPRSSKTFNVPRTKAANEVGQTLTHRYSKDDMLLATGALRNRELSDVGSIHTAQNTGKMPSASEVILRQSHLAVSRGNSFYNVNGQAVSEPAVAGHDGSLLAASAATPSVSRFLNSAYVQPAFATGGPSNSFTPGPGRTALALPAVGMQQPQQQMAVGYSHMDDTLLVRDAGGGLRPAPQQRAIAINDSIALQPHLQLQQQQQALQAGQHQLALSQDGLHVTWATQPGAAAANMVPHARSVALQLPASQQLIINAADITRAAQPSSATVATVPVDARALQEQLVQLQLGQGSSVATVAPLQRVLPRRQPSFTGAPHQQQHLMPVAQQQVQQQQQQHVQAMLATPQALQQAQLRQAQAVQAAQVSQGAQAAPSQVAPASQQLASPGDAQKLLEQYTSVSLQYISQLKPSDTKLTRLLRSELSLTNALATYKLELQQNRLQLSDARRLLMQLLDSCRAHVAEHQQASPSFCTVLLLLALVAVSVGGVDPVFQELRDTFSQCLESCASFSPEVRTVLVQVRQSGLMLRSVEGMAAAADILVRINAVAARGRALLEGVLGKGAGTNGSATTSPTPQQGQAEAQPQQQPQQQQASGGTIYDRMQNSSAFGPLATAHNRSASSASTSSLLGTDRTSSPPGPLSTSPAQAGIGPFDQPIVPRLGVFDQPPGLLDSGKPSLMLRSAEGLEPSAGSGGASASSAGSSLALLDGVVLSPQDAATAAPGSAPGLTKSSLQLGNPVQPPLRSISPAPIGQLLSAAPISAAMLLPTSSPSQLGQHGQQLPLHLPPAAPGLLSLGALGTSASQAMATLAAPLAPAQPAGQQQQQQQQQQQLGLSMSASLGAAFGPLADSQLQSQMGSANGQLGSMSAPMAGPVSAPLPGLSGQLARLPLAQGQAVSYHASHSGRLPMLVPGAAVAAAGLQLGPGPVGPATSSAVLW